MGNSRKTKGTRCKTKHKEDLKRKEQKVVYLRFSATKKEDENGKERKSKETSEWFEKSDVSQESKERSS